MGLIRKVRALLHRDKLAADVDEELRYHLAMREDLNRRAGMPQAEAHLAARRSFGNVTLLNESTREADLLVFLETVLKDIHFAAPYAGKASGFHGPGGHAPWYRNRCEYRGVHGFESGASAASRRQRPAATCERVPLHGGASI